MYKCCIKWIDRNGQPTPDTNDAIGYAICKFDHPSGLKTFGQPLAICATHAARLGANWVFVGIEAQHPQGLNAAIDALLVAGYSPQMLEGV